MLTAAGTEYGVDDIFDLTKMQPYNLEKLYRNGAMFPVQKLATGCAKAKFCQDHGAETKQGFR